MKIRKAKEKDIKGLIPLWWQMHTSHYEYDKRYYKLAPRKKAFEATRNHFEEMIKDKNAIFLVAEKNGELIGSLTAHVADRPPVFPAQKRILLGSVIVDKKHRGKRVYSKLQQRLDRIAREKKARYIELNVDVSNPAMVVYTHKGFIPRQTKLVKEMK